MTMVTSNSPGADVTTFRILAIRSGLKACKIGMRVNRAYTPSALRRTTENLTGLKFKARDYDGMIAALTALLPPEPSRE